HGRLVARRVKNSGVQLDLVAQRRQGGSDNELKLGAEKANPFSARFVQMRQVNLQTGIYIEVDLFAIERNARLPAQGLVLLLLAGAKAGLFRIGSDHFLRRAQIDLARIAINDNRIARLDMLEN